MDQLQTRLDALEQQMHTVTRRLRWWRGLACAFADVHPTDEVIRRLDAAMAAQGPRRAGEPAAAV